MSVMACVARHLPRRRLLPAAAGPVEHAGPRAVVNRTLAKGEPATVWRRCDRPASGFDIVLPVHVWLLVAPNSCGCSVLEEGMTELQQGKVTVLTHAAFAIALDGLPSFACHPQVINCAI